MPDWGALLGGSRNLQELNQYPDVDLYKAAGLLKTEDRPRAPVRLIDPDPKKYPIFRQGRKIEGISDVPNRTIYINRGGEGYASKDLFRLAGTLAHEGEHIRRGDFEEGPAYKRQYEALARMHGVNPEYLKAVFARVK